ncbi:MAG TPA: glycoside hydrolase family 2 TIM barrel-domain containing protein, partial [Balneolales bacterium]|nr:glycoside hydrolase family 2 TIM barrel-domain containing protein [Balneolales bacterium]
MAKKIFLFTIVLFGAFLITNQASAQSRQRLSMDLGWKFKLGDPHGAEKTSYNDRNWRKLDLPHDWSIEGKYSKDAPGGGSFGYLPAGIGWYRKQFVIPGKLLNEEVKIRFDGVYRDSDVWINGHHLGNHPYGYTPFVYDLNPFLKKGKNIIAVRVNNSEQPNTRWYSGSGIYRNVWMIITGHLHIARYGVYVTTPIAKADSGLVNVQTKIRNDYPDVQKARLTSFLLDAQGREVAKVTKDFEVNGKASITLTQQMKVNNPHLWSLESPYLYSIRTIISVGNKELDKKETPFGIREIRYYTNKGFYLDGEHVKMKGVCLHENGGAVGAAVPPGVWERRLKELKKMGVNAIRTAHNPPAPAFLNLCDRLGLLVMDESFDIWTVGKRKYGYQQYFDKWATIDLSTMLLRDRDHPSVVLWSIGNEIPEQSMDKGAAIAKKLVDICHRLDPTRPVTSACDKIADDSNPTKLAFLKQLDIVGYNYVDRWHRRRELFYTPDKIKFPNRQM